MTKVELAAACWVEKNVMGLHNLLLLSHHLVLFLDLVVHDLSFLFHFLLLPFFPFPRKYPCSPSKSPCHSSQPWECHAVSSS